MKMTRQLLRSSLTTQLFLQDESRSFLSASDVESIVLSLRSADATNSYSDYHAAQLIRLLLCDEIDLQLYSVLVKKCLCSSSVVCKLFVGTFECSEGELSFLGDLSNAYVKLLHLYLLKLLNTDLRFEESCVSIVGSLVSLEFHSEYSQLCVSLFSQFFKSGCLWCVSLEDFADLRTKYESLFVFDESYICWARESRVDCSQNDTLSKLRDEIAISHFYSHNPYPLWKQVDALMLKDPHFRDRFLPSLPNAFDSASVESILVAGCGAGQEAVFYSLLFPGSSVVAIDLSAASLLHAKRLADKYNASNLSFRQVDLLELTSEQSSFDLVVSSGVLHHLEIPLQGLKALSDLRSSGGFLKIGLYSAAARSVVEQARSILPRSFRRNPWLSSAELVQARRFLVESFSSAPGLSNLLLFEDFFEINAFRDLLFNPCEHTYDPCSIAAMLKECGLEFDGFQFQNIAVLNTYRKLFPHDVTGKDLVSWQAFEQLFPRAFIGMYNFWCH